MKKDIHPDYKKCKIKCVCGNEIETGSIEQDILKLSHKKYYKDLNHVFIYHGRATCDSRKPKCDICPISAYCKYFNR